MTALASSWLPGFTVGLRSAPSAGPIGVSLTRQTYDVLESLKSRVPAGPSLVFQDLRSLALEKGIDATDSQMFSLAERFLLALPSHLPAPELAMDAEGELVFDWAGSRGRMFTIALRADGRMSYACRMSAFDKDYGTKAFVDAIPKAVLQLLQQVVVGI